MWLGTVARRSLIDAAAPISMSVSRPHCLQASITPRSSRLRAESVASATPRVVIRGTSRLTPSSVSFSTIHFCRSPLGSATASVTGTAGG